MSINNKFSSINKKMSIFGQVYRDGIGVILELLKREKI